MKNYDLVVIGGGPGGYVSAIRASQLGMKTALVEREHLGGICLNWGCIPTKALLKSGELIAKIKNADKYGISVSDLEFDLNKIVARSRSVAGSLNNGIGHLLKKNKIDVYDGHAKLLSSGSIEVDTGIDVKNISADHIIISTGARARSFPGIEPDGKLVWSYKEAMTPDELPKSILVIGAGAIGIEFANFYNALGVEVTVVEAMHQILPFEDNEIADIAAKSFRAKGIKILTNTMVSALHKHENTVTAVVAQGEDKQEIVVDRVISAVGVVGNTESVGLENTKVELDGCFIKVNEWSQTAEPGVYAIGDVAGAPCLAHKASHEGVICVEKISGDTSVQPLDKNSIPGCTYSSPQVASVGFTEKKAIDLGYNVRIGRFPFMANGKAIAAGETEGLVKTIFDAETGELLGAHMVGAEVTEMIQGYVIAKKLETTEEELEQTIFAHPTMSESMHESVLDAFDKALHI
ncbi:MAG: dihydrolipoyl dehydrogenase [Amphritea sp.]